MKAVSPFFSVIVPAFQGASVLPQSLGALAGSDLPREQWELIVVNDGSTDDSAAVAAKWADRVVSLPGPPRGPAFARNRGVEQSAGTWLVFIDADVLVHRDTLSQIAAVAARDPAIDALFGAYDDAPPAPGFLSQYRNLLHRYVHLKGAGEADTFWAGCGAVRKSAFVAVGGFDEQRYPRPQIEDIELGYRLRDRGGRILLSPDVQGAHLKRWRFWGSTRTDVFDRGAPWVRLLLERGKMGQSANLNLKRGERIKTAAVGLALAVIAAALVLRRTELAIAGAVLLGGVEWSNRALISWFAGQRGWLFALGVIPMNVWYYVVSGISVAIGVAQHVLRGPATSTPANAIAFTRAAGAHGASPLEKEHDQ